MIRTRWLLLFFLYTAISLNNIAFAEEHVKNTPSSLMPQLAIPDSNQIQVLETTDGSTNIGRIVEIGAEVIAFKTDLGIIHIPMSKIKHIETVSVDLIHNGEFWFTNPNITRLFFAPTARMLKQGKGYFSDYYIFFPGFAYGITDRFTLGGGLSIFPGVDMDDQVFFIAPKFGLIQEKSFHVAMGALLVRVPDDSKTAGILYGVATFGQPDASLTAGLGYGFVDERFGRSSHGNDWRREALDAPDSICYGKLDLSRYRRTLDLLWTEIFWQTTKCRSGANQYNRRRSNFSRRSVY